jgi:hypothetical protein
MSESSVGQESASAVEIATVVVFLLGGQTRSVHTEDVAIRANEIAPGRFVWRKYPEHIDLQAVRFALENAKREHCGYLIGAGKDGWMLTQAGLEFAEKNAQPFQISDLSGQRQSEADKKWLRSERARLLSSNAFAKVRDGKETEVTTQEAAAFFRVDEYVIGMARDRKITRILNAFHDDPEIGPVATRVAELLNEGESK